MPVLDGNIDDGLSDARSLAASMKGNLMPDLFRTFVYHFEPLPKILQFEIKNVYGDFRR